MTDLAEQKQKANQLRKAMAFEEALPIYRDLWNQTGDEFDGAGYLHCLRKLELFDEAVALARDVIEKHPEFAWCRNEVIWTYIQGMLNKLDDEAPLGKVLEVANKIMDLNPNDLATRSVVFKVLKSAKVSKNWNTINAWVEKIDPESLSKEPIIDESGKKGWSFQALWYNYRIRGLIEEASTKEQLEEAVQMAKNVAEQFPHQRKIFLRLSALGNHKLGNLEESKKVYQELCNRYKTDWWLIHEHGKLVRDLGHLEEARMLMYQAANIPSKITSMVTLFLDIGMLCMQLEMYQESRNHLVLCKYVREEQGWSMPQDITNSINRLNEIIGNDNHPSSLKEALRLCRSEWNKLAVNDENLNTPSYNRREIRNGLIGKVTLGHSDRPFCFITTKDKQSYFCSKSDLPPNILDGEEITFDAIPSFDKKKQEHSCKARNLRH